MADLIWVRNRYLHIFFSDSALLHAASGMVRIDETEHESLSDHEANLERESPYQLTVELDVQGMQAL